MHRPKKYLVKNLIDKTWEETNTLPPASQMQKFIADHDSPNIGRPNIGRLKTVIEVFEDTRYEAKLRLYNYVTYTRNGLEIPRYKPFAGTEIGKSIPILNF